MASTEKGGDSVNKKATADPPSSSDDSDMKMFDKLFLELVAESTASSDPKIADAMKWFKEASKYLAEHLITMLFKYCLSAKF